MCRPQIFKAGIFCIGPKISLAAAAQRLLISYFAPVLNISSSNVIKLVRKDAHQRDGRVQKEQKELSEGKIGNETRRRGLRLKKGA